MRSYTSIFNKIAIEHLVLVMCAMFLAFAIISCDSESNNNDGDNPTPTNSPSPTPVPTPAPTPSPTQVPGTSIIEPGGTLPEAPETFDYVGSGNDRQMLDFYEITGLPSQTASEFSTRGLVAGRPAIVFFHGGGHGFSAARKTLTRLYLIPP